MPYYDDVRAAAEAVRARAGEAPSVAIVLGSGLGDFANSLGNPVSLPYGELPNWPVSRVPGHEGRLVVGTSRGIRIAALAGRCHLYEGHDARTVTFAVRALGILGVKTLILTNAAGGVNTGFAQGALMVIDDHINLTGHNPLVGANDDRFGVRFPDMSEVYSTRLRRLADESSAAIGLRLAHGVYAALLGPSYETPAENPISTGSRGRRGRHVDGPRGHRGPPHGPRGPRTVVHHEHGGGRAAPAARPRRGDGDGATRARTVRRATGGHH